MRRLHGLQWRALTEKRGFDEHLKWHQSPERRHQAARPKTSLAPPPATNLNGNGITGGGNFHGRNGEQISYEEWVAIQMEDWAARESDPVVIDKIGIQETIRLAEELFKEVVGDYLTVWAGETSGNSEGFAEFLDQLRQKIGREVGDLWRKDKWHTEWFDRSCRNKIDEALAALSGEWNSRARQLEIQHLQNPDLTLRSLCAAAGDLGIAHRLDEQMLEKVLQGKEANCANPPVQRGDAAEPDAISATKPKALAETDGETAHKPHGALPERLQSLTHTGGTGSPLRLKRGPKPDYETALRVKEIVAEVAGEHRWRSKLDDICMELDEKMIRTPKTWKKRGYAFWFDCLTEPRLVAKAISHHLVVATQQRKTPA
jgi:hypothetical protein